MLDYIRRFRDLTAWIILVLVSGAMVFGVIRVIVTVATDESALGAAAGAHGTSAMSLTAALIVLGVVSVCLFLKPSSSRAPLITLVGAIVVTVGAAVTFVFMIIAAVDGAGGAVGVVFGLLGSLTDFILKALIAGALWLFLRGQRLGVVGSPMAASTPSAQASAPPVSRPSVAPDVATGWSWKSASDAARGGPAAESASGGVERQWRPVNQRTDEDSG